MAKKIVSMSSLSSEVTDLSINDPRSHSPNPSDRSSTDTNPHQAILRSSLPDLRASVASNYSIQSHQNGPPTTQSPYLNPTHLPPTLEDDAGLLQPPLFRPLPRGPDSPSGSRPSSRMGRPASRGLEDSRDNSRPGSRAASPSVYRPLTPVTALKAKRRRSWIPGKSVFEASEPQEEQESTRAWIFTPHEKIHYDSSPLTSFQHVDELWDDEADTLVYLHNLPSGPGPSFRVDSSCFASSRKLVKAAHGHSHTVATTPNGSSRHTSGEVSERSFSERSQNLMPHKPTSPSASHYGSASNRSSSTGGRSIQGYFDEPAQGKTIHLCLPQPLQADLNVPHSNLSQDDVEALITVRNLFAFLTGRPLVATTKRPSMFAILEHMAEILHRYEFTNFDGSTIGEEAAGSFSRFIIDFRLADVRSSREKTIEAIILGEKLKCWELYNEGFVHAVGKYDAVSTFKSPKLYQMSEITRKRLERSHLFLSTRLRNVRDRLNDFEFPGMFAGLANSTTSSESKIIRFKAWKASFMSMRRHIMAIYKQRYGAWPPKARSKKNDFEESGLNRLLLRQVYNDFCCLYDVLVDRSNLTTRHVEIPTEDGPDDLNESSSKAALRRILGEHDRSTPPVQPPIPFDTPLLPSLSTTRRDFRNLDAKKQQKENGKKLKDSEINTALMQSYNRDLMRSTPFVEEFFAYERRSAHGKSMEEITDMRHGQWLFIYAVIQALPLLVVDAPGLKCTDGVEYFLSEFSKESPPWMRQTHGQKTTWRVPGSETMVHMPAASVEHSNDAIYQRSHCWQAAEQWAGPKVIAEISSPLDLPNEQLLPPVMPSEPDSRAASRSPDRRRSMGLSLEQLPLPLGVAFSDRGSRPTSSYDPNKSFNSILGVQDGAGKKKK